MTTTTTNDIATAAWEAWEGPYSWAQSYGAHTTTPHGDITVCGGLSSAGIDCDEDLIAVDSDDIDVMAAYIGERDTALTAEEAESVAAMVLPVCAAAANLHAIAEEVRDAQSLADLSEALEDMRITESDHGDAPSADAMTSAAWGAAAELVERVEDLIPAGSDYELEPGDWEGLVADLAAADAWSDLDTGASDPSVGDEFYEDDRVRCYAEGAEEAEASATWDLVSEEVGHEFCGGLADAIRDDWIDRRAQSLIAWVESTAEDAEGAVIVDYDCEEWRLTADWAQSDCNIAVDGKTTPFQVADAGHDIDAAVTLVMAWTRANACSHEMDPAESATWEWEETIADRCAEAVRQRRAE